MSIRGLLISFRPNEESLKRSDIQSELKVFLLLRLQPEVAHFQAGIGRMQYHPMVK